MFFGHKHQESRYLYIKILREGPLSDANAHQMAPKAQFWHNFENNTALNAIKVDFWKGLGSYENGRLSPFEYKISIITGAKHQICSHLFSEGRIGIEKLHGDYKLAREKNYDYNFNDLFLVTSLRSAPTGGKLMPSELVSLSELVGAERRNGGIFRLNRWIRIHLPKLPKIGQN